MQPLQRSRQRRFRQWFFIAFGAIWTAASCCFVAVGLPATVAALAAAEGLTGGDQLAAVLPALTPVACGLPFMAIGIAIAALGIRPLVAGAKVARPDISVSAQSPRVGEEFNLNYQQAFKGAAEVERVVFQLIFRETATYRRGTDTVTVHHDTVAQEFEAPGRRFEAGEVFYDRRLLRIPDEAMHTFIARRNRLEWLIKVRVQIAGWPDFDEEYPLAVPPERAG